MTKYNGELSCDSGLTGCFDKKYFDNQNIKTLDISNIQNDFIYKLIDYYLEEITLELPHDINKSVMNLVDTVMRFYLLAQQHGVINISDSRKILELNINKNKTDNDSLNQAEQFSEEFKKLEKYLTNNVNKHINIQKNSNKENESKCNVPQIDELLQDHENFMSEILKQSSDIKNSEIKIMNDTAATTALVSPPIKQVKLESEVPSLTPTEVIDKITILENKLKKSRNNNFNKINGKTIISDFDISTSETNYLLNTNEKNVIKKYSHNNQTSNYSVNVYKDKLNEALKKLYSRLDTPLINIIITIVIIKFMILMFGF